MAQVPQILTPETAPPVFSREVATTLSKRYTQINTDLVIDALAPLGWSPFGWQRMRRNRAGLASGRSEATSKHLVRLQRTDIVAGSDVPQIVLVNSHDGSSPWLFLVGLHVFVCANGLISNRDGWTIRLKHIGLVMSDVLTAVCDLAAKFPELLDTRDRYSAILLSEAQALDFARQAGRLRWPEPIEFSSLALLNGPHSQRGDKSLFGRFNDIQGNLTGKGVVTTDPNRPKNKTRRSRAINAIGETVSVNQGLWELLDSFGNYLTASPVLV